MLLKGFLIWLIISGSFETFSQYETQPLSADQILTLLPEKINGFNLSTAPRSKVIKLGTLQYSMAEKDFKASRAGTIKILLFDYKGAPIMFTQATRRLTAGQTIESDSVIRRPTTVKDCIGVESYNARTKQSQILIGIYNRFYLSLEGTKVELEFLKKVVQEFKIETFPK
jgi:hypothetical protein